MRKLLLACVCGDQKKAAEAASRLAQCAVKAGADPSSLIEKMKSLQ